MHVLPHVYELSVPLHFAHPARHLSHDGARWVTDCLHLCISSESPQTGFWTGVNQLFLTKEAAALELDLQRGGSAFNATHG